MAKRKGTTVKITEDDNLVELLEQLPIELRLKELKKAVRKGGKVTERQARKYAPRGDKKHKPEKKPLYKTMITRIVSYQNNKIWLAVVGPGYPAGAHGHLVEDGHDIVARGTKANPGGKKSGGKKIGRAKKQPFLERAGRDTEKQAGKVVVEALTQAIKNAKRKAES